MSNSVGHHANMPEHSTEMARAQQFCTAMRLLADGLRQSCLTFLAALDGCASLSVRVKPHRQSASACLRHMQPVTPSALPHSKRCCTLMRSRMRHVHDFTALNSADEGARGGHQAESKRAGKGCSRSATPASMPQRARVCDVARRC